MKALVVYESYFGNTEKIALALRDALAPRFEVEAMKASDARPGDLEGLDLLVVGSPTRAFRPVRPVLDFLKSIPRGSLDGVAVAAFDTRAAEADQRSRMLRWMMRTFGYAAGPLAKKLKRKGGIQAAAPAGFVVRDTEGPLSAGELARAAAWAEAISEG